MLQLTQKLKTGQMRIIDVPIPAVQKRYVLVGNHYSLISSETEASTVKAARKGYIDKAIERPQQVKQAIDVLKTQGPAQTYRTIMKKLDAFSPLGYSCVGRVLDTGQSVKGITVGDFVACGGLNASHAEVVSVPINLCVKLEPDADLSLASYNLLGAIALQGFRQADLRLGESCAVIGLGLLGQLTAILLRAAGIRVIGIDVDNTVVDIGNKHCLDLALNRDDKNIENCIFDFTAGKGCDATIITAASDSLDPINLAGAISQKKGTIVV
ncbi:MAG: zinc-dependent alcohol dehydrogenase, partial [Planctomycetota bacterium]